MQPRTPSNSDIALVDELAKVYLSRYHELEKFLERPTKDWDLQNTCIMPPHDVDTAGVYEKIWLSS
jgi:hypothetical protein